MEGGGAAFTDGATGPSIRNRDAARQGHAEAFRPAVENQRSAPRQSKASVCLQAFVYRNAVPILCLTTIRARAYCVADLFGNTCRTIDCSLLVSSGSALGCKRVGATNPS
jgi:hypothetical protein